MHLPLSHCLHRQENELKNDVILLYQLSKRSKPTSDLLYSVRGDSTSDLLYSVRTACILSSTLALTRITRGCTCSRTMGTMYICPYTQWCMYILYCRLTVDSCKNTYCDAGVQSPLSQLHQALYGGGLFPLRSRLLPASLLPTQHSSPPTHTHTAPYSPSH